MRKTTLSALILLATSGLAQAQIMINEFCAANDTVSIGGHYADWVELYNAGSSNENLRRYALSDNPKNPTKYVIDSDIIIPAGSTRLILCNGLGTGANASFKLSGTGGEHIVLSNPEGKIIDDIAIKPLRKDYSYGRIYDGASEWAVFAVSSPDRPNMESDAMASKPVFSVTPGFYSSRQTVTISSSGSATIYYTTNGSEPTKSSTKYTGPITISTTTPLRAMATMQGRVDSEIESGTYFINSQATSLPVISLITERKNFYDNKIGIYVAGTNGITGNCQNEPKNWNQDWERPVHIEYFDKNKKLQISQDAGIKITGSCSRGQNMKSLRVIARKEYGDTRLRYKFFDKKDISEFKSIVLRNGGNDFGLTMYRDGLVSGLAGESLDIDVQAFQPCVVFLNGEYLGLHNIREKVSAHYLEENYGVDADMVDILENSGWANEGSQKDYDNLINFVKNNSLKDQANYNKVAAQMDIDNFIDYWCAQIYIDNEDWPNNNIKWWRTQGTGGKWRWIMFGAEFSCNIYGGSPDRNSVYNAIDINSDAWGTKPTSWGNLLMRRLLENDGFRSHFIQRMAYLMDHTYNYDRVSEFADSLQSLIRNDYPKLAERWPDWWSYTWDWESRCRNMKEWFQNRPMYIEQHMQNYFGVGPRYQLEASSDNSNTKFSLNGSMPTANINGQYFSGATVELGARLPQGIQVDYWEIDGTGTSTNKLVEYGSDNWMYYNESHAPYNNWKALYYDETGWKNGKAPLGYSSLNIEATKLQYGNDPNNKWMSYYFRKKFSIDTRSQNILNATINLKIDDGAIVYINGTEVGRILMKEGNADFGTNASSYYGDVASLPVNTIIVPAHLLNNGDNMLVVELHQCSNVSSDIHIDAEITYTTTSGRENLKLETPTASFVMGSDTRVTLHTKAAPAPPERTQPVSNLYVNEIMPYNYGAVADEDSHFPAWIELYNGNASPIDLSGLYIMDKKNEYQLPYCGNGELTIPAHGYLLLFADGNPELGPQHLGISIKPEKDGAIYLGEIINGQSRYIHWMEYPAIGKNESFGLVSDGGSSTAVFASSSPYQSNSYGQKQDPSKIFTVVENIESPLDKKYTIYPNPAHDIIYIDSDEDVDYQLISKSGSVLLSGRGRSIKLDNILPGFYLVKIQDGKIIKGLRLIKL
ncbi:MAG: CotH kinase family protein [Bacteroidales bacterium]|nr:CotH kinase family protein [Bacteroidales bacterium]